MSSDEDYSQRETSDGLRRSKRVAKHDKVLRSKAAKKKPDEKPAKRSAAKTKSTPAKKSKFGEDLRKEETSELLNSSCLTKNELTDLYLKFKRDGHFRLSPQKVSQPPLVISRITDGKNVTTKIECYETKRQFVNLASRFAAQNTGTEFPKATSDPTSVTFTTPVTEQSFGNSISTIPNSQQFILPGDNNFVPYKTSNYSQTLANSLLDTNRSPNGGNACLGNSTSSTFKLTSFLMTTNSQQSVSARPNPVFVSPAPTTWIPLDQSILENRNDSNASGIYFASNNKQYSSTVVSNKVNVFDNNNSENNPSACRNNPSLVNQFNFLNFNTAGPNVTSYQQREANAQNSSSNVFGTNVSTIYTSPISSMSYVPPTIVPYNPEIGNVGSSTYAVSSNGNTSTNQIRDVYRSPLASWNGAQLLPNTYDTIVSMPYVPYNAYGTSSASVACETTANPVISDQQGGMIDQTNTWSQCNQIDKDFLQTNGNETCESSPTAHNNFPSSAAMIGSNVLAPIVDSEVELSQPTEQSAFNLEIVGDCQNGGTGLIDPPNWAFDYDAIYDKYARSDLHCNGENLDSVTQESDFSSRLPSVRSIKTEMRSWYRGNKDDYTNNNPSNNASDLEYYDFEEKENLADSSSCYVANGPSST